MLKTLMRSIEYNQSLDMVYMDKQGQISKRRVKILQVGETSFRAYCFMRGSGRTFRMDNVLALVPVIKMENMVI